MFLCLKKSLLYENDTAINIRLKHSLFKRRSNISMCPDWSLTKDEKCVMTSEKMRSESSWPLASERLVKPVLNLRTPAQKHQFSPSVRSWHTIFLNYPYFRRFSISSFLKCIIFSTSVVFVTYGAFCLNGYILHCSILYHCISSQTSKLYCKSHIRICLAGFLL